MKEKTTIAGRLAKNEPPLQDYWPAEKRTALANITFHYLYGTECTGKDCDVCKEIKELKNEQRLSRI